MGCQRQARKGAWPLRNMPSSGRIRRKSNALHTLPPLGVRARCTAKRKNRAGPRNINFEDDAGRRATGAFLTRDEARRVAINIARCRSYCGRTQNKSPLRGRARFVPEHQRSAKRSRHPSALAPHSAVRNSAQCAVRWGRSRQFNFAILELFPRMKKAANIAKLAEPLTRLLLVAAERDRTRGLNRPCRQRAAPCGHVGTGGRQ